MRIFIIAVGTKMPAWIATGFSDYLKRFPKEIKIELIEVSKEKAQNESAQLRKEKEAQKILQKIPSNAYVIALEIQGKLLNTEQWSLAFQEWQRESSKICFLIGGPDGLAKSCLDIANERWSLSLLTFPHALVRVLLMEQLYRVYSLLTEHPYHRG